MEKSPQELENYFGHTGVDNGSYNLAVCENCLGVAFMSASYRNYPWPSRILGHLDERVKCCSTPNYQFTQVYILTDSHLST